MNAMNAMNAMTPNTYKILERCVEEGVEFGHRRAFKHIGNPSDTAIREEIVNAVMLEISEWFDFPEINTEEK